MKNILLLLLLAAFSRLTSQHEINITWDQEDIICKESARADKLLHAGHFRNEFAFQTDIHYQRMAWEINPAVKFIKGEITYYFKSLVPDLSELVLDLSTELQVKGIHRTGNALSYTHANELLKIQLGKNLPVGAYDTLTVIYEGIPTSNGFGSFVQAQHAGAPILWTLSEPYGARDWWPNKQDLVDKVDSVDIFITTPPGNLAASNGKLESSLESNNQVIHHWRHRYPIVAYLIALSVTNYEDYQQFVPLDNGDSIEILNYVYPESLTAAKQSTMSSIDIMQLYNDKFGIYPFAAEKYGHAQFGWGGGEEHQTMSFMGNFSFGLQAHEMAHQWFGNKVTCGSWTDIWLNEGFATYLTGLTYEAFSPVEFWPLWKSSTSNSATSRPDGSVFVDDTTNVGRIFNGVLSYNKGAYLLHMMRWISGDSAFYQACRNYLDIPGTAYDFGRTDELKGYFENATGKDFDEFLADWFYGQGYPSYHLSWTQQTDSLIVWVGQQQSHPSVSFFEMPIPILAVLDGSQNIFRVEHTMQDQRYSFFIGGANVDSVGFDPAKWVLSKNNTITEIMTGVGHPSFDDRFIVYPNPASDFIGIIPSAEVGSLTFVNVTGVQVDMKNLNGNIDVSLLSPGLYTLLIKDSTGSILSIKRIVIHP